MKFKNIFVVLFFIPIYAGDAAQLQVHDYTQLECYTRPCLRRAHTRGTSHNWSGYVAVTDLDNPQEHAVQAVRGSWIVPSLDAAKRRTWCALWIGMDGYNNNFVEQIGTEHDWRGGMQVDYAWFEMYPQPARAVVDFPLQPGDHISASVEYQEDGKFVLTIANDTQKVYVTVPVAQTVSLKAPRASAEWVLEAPSMLDVLPLSHFNTAFFSHCSAIIQGGYGAINYHAWKHDQYNMMTADDAVVRALSSGLSADGHSFTVAWQHE